MPVQSVTPGDASLTAKASSAAKTTAPRASFAGALAHASTAATPKAPKNETSKAVAGHAYSDILSGPRNGMYLNTSGNKRDGQAFVLVKRDGKEFHIYGTGKDRVVVCLKRKTDTDGAAAAPKTTAPVTDTAPSGTTGAAS